MGSLNQPRISLPLGRGVVKNHPPQLALTLGDPAGIGPEIVLKALGDPEIQQIATITVIGDRTILEDTFQLLQGAGIQELANPEGIPMIDCKTGIEFLGTRSGEKLDRVEIGHGNARTGAASYGYLTTAIRETLAGRFGGIVTGPIAKFAWTLAGHSFPGQTEVLAQLSGSQRYGMLFVARSPYTHWTLKVLLATTHVPLREVPLILNADLIRSKLDLLSDRLEKEFGITDPVIAVSGLNPHSGEAGQLGREEVEWLIPCLQEYAKDPDTKGQIRGPIPPDTLWIQPAQAWHDRPDRGADAYLALYHDQGLIPVKVLAFDRAVNTTIGLPFVRTSPDHGTAFDIAGRGIADPQSLKEAIRLAAELILIRPINQLQSDQVNPVS